MSDNETIHPNAPAGGGGPGTFTNAGPLGSDPDAGQFQRPGPLGAQGKKDDDVKLTITGVVVAGGPLSKLDIIAVNEAAKKTPSQFRRFVAYERTVKVGGSLAWRANNPGNLRDAATKIGSVPGAVGHFAVFAAIEDGRAAQRDLYLTKYGDMKVRDAVSKLTPPSENDTKKYLEDLETAGVDLDKDVKSQIDALMKAIQVNEGLIEGTELLRTL